MTPFKQQLRFGNLINEIIPHPIEKNAKVHKVDIHILEELHKGSDKYAPIPFTKEWAEKFGLKEQEKRQGEYWKPILGGKIIAVVNWDEKKSCFFLAYNRVRNKYFSTVHDFQNFWYSHFDEEIELVNSLP